MVFFATRGLLGPSGTNAGDIDVGTEVILNENGQPVNYLMVKIPYRKGAGYGKTVTSGSSGLSTKIFLLSSTEVNLVHGYEPTNEGACLSYFSGIAQNGADNKRVAKLNGSATRWWLRSPYCGANGGSARALSVEGNGNWGNYDCSNTFGLRPALILPYEFKFASDQIAA